MLQAIHQKLHLTWPAPASIRAVALILRATERRDLLPPHEVAWPELATIWVAARSSTAAGPRAIVGTCRTIGFLLLVSLVANSALAALGEWWGGAFESFKWHRV